MNLAAKEPIVTSPTDDGLPEGWTRTSLGAVVKPSKVRIEPRDCPDTAYLSLEHIEAQTRAIIGRGVGTDVSSMKSVFHAGDVLYGKLRPYLNKVCRPDFDGICSTDILVFPATQSTDSRFLLYYLNCAEVVEYANHHSNGINLPRISFEKLAEMEFSLPPLAEQRRIVAKLEEILAAASTTRARLARVPILLKRFRQSVLAAACSGRLTADWREANPDTEPASKLLERILAERRAKWEAEQIVKRRGRAKVSGDDLLFTKEELNARGPLTFNERVLGSENEDFQPFSRAAGGVVSGYKGPSAPDVSDLTELPGNWDWITVDQIADVGSGATPLRKNIAYYENGNIPWITSGALNDLFVSSAEEYITALALKETNVKILPVGTLLIAMYGEGKTRGKVSELAIDATTNQACASLSFHKTGHLCKPFAKLFFEKNYLDIRLMSAGGVQPNLNLSIIKDTILPLPPLPEQQEIVRRVERLFHLVDIIEKRTDAASLRADRLTQTILAKAFRGELVPTEAELARAEGHDYEPASVLLERVLTDRKTKEPVATPREVTLQERF